MRLLCLTAVTIALAAITSTSGLAQTSSSRPHSSTARVNPFVWGTDTWFVASRRPVPSIGNPDRWYDQARRLAYPVGQVPRVGAIYVSREGVFGHVGIVTAVRPFSSYRVCEMDFAGYGVVDCREIIPGSVPLIGFIYDR